MIWCLNTLWNDHHDKLVTWSLYTVITVLLTIFSMLCITSLFHDCMFEPLNLMIYSPSLLLLFPLATTGCSLCLWVCFCFVFFFIHLPCFFSFHCVSEITYLSRLNLLLIGPLTSQCRIPKVLIVVEVQLVTIL